VTGKHTVDEFSVRLIARLDGILSQANFQRRSKGSGWRTTNRKIDVVELEFLRKARCSKWRIPEDSFTVKWGCFLPFIPPRNNKTYKCGRALDPKPREVSCHVRFMVFKQVRQPQCEPPNIWCPPRTEREQEAVIQDLVHAVRDKALPFFAFVEDLDRFLDYLSLQDDHTGREGIWGIGKIGSFSRLYITGFTALEIGKWALAAEALQASLTKATSLSIGSRREIMDCIRHAIGLAEQHRSLE